MDRRARGAWWHKLRRRKVTLVGAFFVLFMAVVAIGADHIATHDPTRISVRQRLQPPGPEHLLGTDHLGRSVFSRVVHGARISLGVGVSVVIFAMAWGTLIGLLAGYFRNLDAPLMRVMDGLMAFPDILLAIALMASLGPNLGNVILALGIVYTPRVARLIRGSVLVVRELTYIEAARALGASNWRIAWRHLLPNCLSPLIVQGTFIFAYAVLGEAGLSFLGVGIPPHIPSWGTILSEGRLHMQQAPWITISPGLAVVFTVFGLNLLGDGLRDFLDPRLRKL